ncbi:MAG TPA: GNAT family N-acetyltransferase [Dehalococcoidia bacterium]|nr:GNAT family N-acetyltransferase [Dehalococcoidia bacterium]
MEHQWSIRPYTEGDEEGIFELNKAVSPSDERNREQWMQWWHWMYKESPAGNGRIWLAEHEGRIVGQYPLIFLKLKVGNRIIKASQNIDIMIHPDYRYQGMFSKLERQALDEAEKVGVYITIGFPNEAAYPGHMKSGWFDVATMQRLFKPLNWGDTLRIRFRNKLLLKFLAAGGNLTDKVLHTIRETPIVEGLTISQIPHFDDRIDDFWTMVSNQYQIMVVRNKDYLNWRYVTIPDVEYSIFVAEKAKKIYGYLVLRCVEYQGRKSGTIFDILTQSEPITRCLISKVMEHCRQERVAFISYDIIANKAYLKALRSNGFISLPSRKGARFGAYSSSPHISREFLMDSRNWFVQMGDSDAI